MQIELPKSCRTAATTDQTAGVQDNESRLGHSMLE